MKNKSLLIEIVTAILLIILTVALLNPFYWWMPDMVTMTVMLALIMAFVIFAGFIWKEQAKDERELLHRMLAGRWAFLAGIAMLVLAVVVQGLKHQIDYWLVIVLVAMVLTKIASLIYSRNKY